MQKKSKAHDVVDPAPREEFSRSEWRATATIIAVDDAGRQRYLRKATLSDLLTQVKDGTEFRFKGGMHTTKNLGEGEFRLALAWMRANGLAEKHGRKYMIPSIEEVKRAWNQVISEEASL